MNRCPEGHDSSTSDYCDVCGIPMTGDPAPAAPPVAPTPDPDESAVPAPAAGDGASPATGATQTCPHCGAVNAEANLFCEVCGFDFTTGVMPRVEGGDPSYLPPVVPVSTRTNDGPPDAAADVPDPDSPEPAEASMAPEAPVAPVAEPEVAGASPVEPGEAGEAGEASVLTIPASDDAPAVDAPSAPPAEASGQQAPGQPAPERSTPDRPALDPTPPGSDPVRRQPKPVNRPPSRAVAGDWVVEVWVDPDWYAVQDAADPCPSVGPPEIVRITGSDALIGRRTRSSLPDVDCGLDSAVSRRQALLTSDGRRWWVEDLDSSNGTWVAPAIGPLPTEPISTSTEIDADDRIYVGAWTRIVLRPAVASETADD